MLANPNSGDFSESDEDIAIMEACKRPSGLLTVIKPFELQSPKAALLKLSSSLKVE